MDTKNTNMDITKNTTTTTIIDTTNKNITMDTKNTTIETMETMETYKNKNKNKIYPFIDELVDALYTDELNKMIDSENVQVDKKTFIMFIIMYFVTRINSDVVDKESIKYFLTDLIRTPEKRHQCIEIFLMFEKSITSTIYNTQHKQLQ